MSRATVVRAVLALVVLAVSGWLLATRPPRLGLDLRGGTQIVLETRDGEFAKADAVSTGEALEVLRRRVDEFGVAEPTLARSGERRIIVELPGVTEPAEAVRIIGRTAQLSFHPVLGVESSAQTGTGGELVLPSESGEKLRLGPAALSGQQVDNATAGRGEFTGWQVSLDFRGTGAEAWRKLTADAACAAPGEPARRVGIVLDREVISSPQVNEDVVCNTGIAGGRTQITGEFTAAEAKDLALLIRAGGLPVPVEVIEQRTVGPSLGAAAIDASATAAVLGMIATVLFIVAVYRLVGGVAAVALVCYGLISYAALLAIGATLTLPGLAGFVLAIGMALDANVLVFERAREEYAAGGPRRSLRTAMRAGFANAWSAIADSNVTTLLAGGLLFFLASGPVRGFGVTLSVGVLVSMFTALVLTRALSMPLVNARWLARRPNWSGLGGIGWVRQKLETRNPDIMGRRRLWLAVSVAAVVLALAGVAVRGLNLGVEFTGGRLVEYATTAPLSADTARDAVESAGLERAVVNPSGDGNISVRAGSFGDDTEAGVRSALAQAGGGEIQRLRDEKIGPTLGEELRRNALIALGVALTAQLAYLAIRFRWQWATAAVLAMFHDVLLVVGVFAWLGRPIDGIFLAALLTVIGYSVNDSVVNFDRIRELVRAKGNRGIPFARLVNTGSLQTVPRTVNTGLGAVVILAALAALGESSLVDFALVLLIGIVVGTYSTVFLAAPLAVVFVGPAVRHSEARRVRAG
ncbi:protein translocase subunit SecD [Paractinoplanes rishiriensis]|uniref:Multifunctional fusion protein n=1 Tax=Paractinoplanes rishiriensis TaxID=1050105 RepID=A0A919KA01_9ACTN|nr:protein translocase subunit SecD [Actinoplanes rishiriensis]GIF01435.1 protein translocase subunit SecDF [Actinoplanes rishiriensis]